MDHVRGLLPEKDRLGSLNRGFSTGTDCDEEKRCDILASFRDAVSGFGRFGRETVRIVC